MSDDDQPETHDLFDDDMPNDVVAHVPEPTDVNQLRAHEGQRVHLYVPEYSDDVDGLPLSVGWRHEGSGTLYLPQQWHGNRGTDPEQRS